jgi:hypothetical protein
LLLFKQVSASNNTTWSSPAHSGTSTSPRLSAAVITPTKSEVELSYYGEIQAAAEDGLNLGESGVLPLCTEAVAGLPQLNAMTLFAFHVSSLTLKRFGPNFVFQI